MNEPSGWLRWGRMVPTLEPCTFQRTVLLFEPNEEISVEFERLSRYQTKFKILE